MLPINPLGLTANHWQFLSAPEKYVDASRGQDRKLVLESTRRQFLTARDILARLNGSHNEVTRRGVLLADDVGLGKTTVAALVAWVVASAGTTGRTVRILAPNEVMKRRWEEELKSHVALLNECAPALHAEEKQVKAEKVKRLSAGSIQVVKHSYASSDLNLKCNLLIVDEAHRAKGEGTGFSKALIRQRKYADRILILTATPFSIKLEELGRMLDLIGGQTAHASVNAFSRALDNLYSGNTARSPEEVAKKLATKATAAVDALRDFVIRHGIDDLAPEQDSFGRWEGEDWCITVQKASSSELALMLRMDRLLRVAKDDGAAVSEITNDPRFHVGWRHFDEVRERLRIELEYLSQPAQTIVGNQLKTIKRLRDEVGVHPKISAVAAEVKSIVERGEKVVLFCHHHATAQELTAHLAAELPKLVAAKMPDIALWRKVWDELLEPAGEERHDELLRDTFIDWLCADLIRAQTWAWIRMDSFSKEKLKNTLMKSKARHSMNTETISESAQHLFHSLRQSKSSRAVLLATAHGRPDHPLPGANGASRVLGVCDISKNEDEFTLFSHNQQPDTVISIFNSPFGPDVLVVTDKLSEGIDLHRYCRHLIHYELDPSPIRTVQRNGRIRRVNSWAAVTNQPINYAYPAFGGTRDHRLVEIMKKRINCFSLLLGGVHDIVVEEIAGAEEEWRNRVIDLARKQLHAASGRLCTQDPKNKTGSR